MAFGHELGALIEPPGRQASDILYGGVPGGADPKGVPEVRVRVAGRRTHMLRSIGLQPGRLCGRMHRRFSSVPAAAKARLGAVPSASSRVAIVYGTFASETSAEDAEIMQDYAMRNKLDLLMQVTGGDEFDFDSLASCSHLVLSTSSWRGQPPVP